VHLGAEAALGAAQPVVSRLAVAPGRFFFLRRQTQLEIALSPFAIVSRLTEE
jgi:hypothetical protein